MNTENKLKERPVIFYIKEIGQKLAEEIADKTGAVITTASDIQFAGPFI